MEGNNQNPMNIRIHQGFWTRDQVARDVDSVYVFGDNIKDSIDLYVPKSTQACIRGLPNVVGVNTKVSRGWKRNDFFSDISLPTFKTLVEASIWKIYAYSESGKTIVFPSDGIGTGKAMLKEKAPKCWDYLCKRLKEEFGYANGQTE